MATLTEIESEREREVKSFITLYFSLDRIVVAFSENPK